MLLISYDISDTKLRNKFSKYLSKFGHRLQYSVFEIDNSKRILDNITAEIKNRFEKQFSEKDSIMIFNINENCKISRFGYAKHDEEDIIIVE